MSLIRFYPEAELQKEVDRIFDGFINRTVLGGQPGWNPRIDVTENNDAFVLHVDVPGIARDEINVTVEDGLLTIAGERKNREDLTYLRRESGHGSFSRSFKLGDRINIGQISAKHSDGVLILTLPKAEEAKPKTIQVKAGK